MFNKLAFIAIVILSSLFLSVNIYLTQRQPPYFFEFMYERNERAAVHFIKKIAGQPYFGHQLDYFMSLYGASFAQKVSADDSVKTEEIKRLETLLETQKDARDVFVKLAIAHHEDNNDKKAREYYQHAKRIDPEVYIDILEKDLR